MTCSTRTPSAAAVGFAHGEEIERAGESEEERRRDRQGNREQQRALPGGAGQTPHHPEHRRPERLGIGEGEEEQDRRRCRRRRRRRPRGAACADRAPAPARSPRGTPAARRASAPTKRRERNDPDAEPVEVEHDRRDGPRRGAAGDAEDERVGEGIPEQRLEGHATEGQCRAAEGGEHDPRCPEPAHDGDRRGSPSPVRARTISPSASGTAPTRTARRPTAPSRKASRATRGSTDGSRSITPRTRRDESRPEAAPRRARCWARGGSPRPRPPARRSPA